MQKDHEFQLKSLEERLDKVKAETSDLEEKNQTLSTEISELENIKTKKVTDFETAEQNEKDMLIPLIKKHQDAIDALNKALDDDEQKMEKMQQTNAELAEAILKKEEYRDTKKEAVADKQE